MNSILVAPSLLSADFNNLGKDVEMLNKSSADWIHLDIMDGVFVPNISFGFPVISHVKKIAEKPLDVHLMIVNPDKYIDDFIDAGADILTVHYEACKHLHRTVSAIKEKGAKAGVSINPHTPVSNLKYIINELDLVLIMSVNPGFGGQKFIKNSIDKIKELREMSDSINPQLIIQVDGGVDISNAAEIVNSGADCLVAGSAVFKADNPTETINNLKNVKK